MLPKFGSFLALFITLLISFPSRSKAATVESSELNVSVYASVVHPKDFVYVPEEKTGLSQPKSNIIKEVYERMAFEYPVALAPLYRNVTKVLPIRFLLAVALIISLTLWRLGCLNRSVAVRR
jgi:hypothetical protein